MPNEQIVIAIIFAVLGSIIGQFLILGIRRR